MKRLIRLVFPMVLLATASACTTGGGLDAERLVRGRIETILLTPQLTDVRAFVRIKGEPATATGHSEADISITPKTKIFQLEGDVLTSVPLDSLAVGQRVEATFAGEISGTTPISGLAGEIVILGR